MERFIVGDVVIVPFPFSDLFDSRRRPALVVATLQGDDVILCQITGQNKSDRYAIRLDNAGFAEGGLNRSSNIRTNRLFTAANKLVAYKAGKIKRQKMTELRLRLKAIFGT